MSTSLVSLTLLVPCFLNIQMVLMWQHTSASRRARDSRDPESPIRVQLKRLWTAIHLSFQASAQQ